MSDALEATPTVKTPHAGYRSASREIKTNLDVRRLMFVLMHVLLPGIVLAAAEGLAGASYPPALLWFPARIALLTGATLAISGAFVCLVLSRTYFGQVVNATKMEFARTGRLRLRSFRWRSITMSFSLFSALTAGAGLALAVLALGRPWWTPAAGGSLAGALLLLMPANHALANRLARRLSANWAPEALSSHEVEAHVRLSLEAVNQDQAVVVTMAAAVFIGFFAAMANLGGVNDDLAADIGVTLVKRWGLPVLSGYGLLVLLLSARMLLRLRVKQAAHATMLAALHGEVDTPYRFRMLERTFLFYGFTLALAALSAMMLARSCPGWERYAAAAVPAVLLAGFLYYRLVLGTAAVVARIRPQESPFSG